MMTLVSIPTSLVLSAWLAAGGVPADPAPPTWHLNATDDGVALDGRDVVSYRLDGGPAPGLPEHEVEHAGLRYRFANAENAKRFESDPERYLPAWGGWCAFMIAIDSEATGWPPRRLAPDPTRYAIEDDRLFLFSNFPGFDPRAKWQSTEDDARLTRGDSFWSSRVELAQRFPILPDGMHRMAPMETAWFSTLMGEWDAEYTFRVSRQDERMQTVRGEWSFRYAWDGFAVFDDWQLVGGAPGNSGPAVRSFDPVGRLWTNHYLPINTPLSASWHFESVFDESGMHGELELKDPDGTPYLQRIHFRDIERDAFVWSCDRSYDGGETWTIDWGVGRQTRAKR